MHVSAHRVQAALGNLLATVIPRARIVPAVRGEDMSADPATVSLQPGHGMGTLPSAPAVSLAAIEETKALLASADAAVQDIMPGGELCVAGFGLSLCLRLTRRLLSANLFKQSRLLGRPRW